MLQKSVLSLTFWGILLLMGLIPLCHAGEIAVGHPGFYPDMDEKAGVIHLTFMGEQGGVFYMRSVNGGSSWAGPWGVVDAGDANNKTGRPTVSGDSQGRAHFAWSNGSNSAFYQRFEDGSFIGKQTAIGSNIVVEPDIAVDMNDVAHIVAMTNDGSWFIGHANNPGGSWSGVRQVSDKFHNAHIGAPSICADDVGSCHAAWKQENGGAFPHYSRFSVVNGNWTDHVTLGPSGGTGDPDVAVTSDGYPRVAWAEYRNDGGWFVYGVMFAWKDVGGWRQFGKVSPGGHISEGFASATPKVVVDELCRSYITWAAENRLRMVAHDCSSNSMILGYETITKESRQFYHGACAFDDIGMWVYEDERGGMYASWGNPEDPPGPVQGDVNGDGRVNGEDLVRLSIAFGTSAGHPRWDEAADLDNNGTIDGNDLAILGGNFGRG